MTNKKIFTRAEFEKLRQESAEEMDADQQLRKEALQVLIKGDQYRWIHQTNWFGEPVLNLPQDLFALQEIIFKTRPKYIVEIGVAWGGSLLFYSTLMEILGGEQIIGVDIFIPDDLKTRLASHGNISKRLSLITGSSIEAETFTQVVNITGNCREVMIILDSYHTHDHVLKELRLYSPLVGNGHYLVCGDTIVDDMSIPDNRTRPWGPGNNPKTALSQFSKENDRFEIDKTIENKLLLTCNPGGYLRCCKD